MLRNYCTKCHKFYSLDDLDFDNPVCDDCGGLIKPDVVLYGEPLDNRIMEDSIKKIMTADTLIILGTSLVVNPAASLVNYFRGNNLVLINLDKTPYDSYCDLVINDDIVKVIKELEELGE